MRRLLLVCGVFLIGFAGAHGCADDDDKKPAANKVVAVPKELSRAEEDLLKMRDDLLNNRRTLQDERAELDEEIRRTRAAGGDTKELEKKVEALAKKEQGLDEDESKFNTKLDQILAQRGAIAQALAAVGGSEAGKMAIRETGVAEREKAFALREARVTKREAKVAQREREAAKAWKEKCGFAPPTTIIQTVDVKGSKYTKRDVEPLLKRARKRMNRKGILRQDLSGPVQGLEKEATKAMAEGDYGRARFAAAQLVATIEATKINKAFIANKIDWLSRRMKGRKLDAAKQKEVDKLFRGAVTAYGNDKFTIANRNLNKIYSKIR